MRHILTVTAVLLATATAASAMKPTDLDIDGDGFASLAEVRQIFPGFSSNDFRDIDVNRDRRLGNKELNASGTRISSVAMKARCLLCTASAKLTRTEIASPPAKS